MPATSPPCRPKSPRNWEKKTNLLAEPSVSLPVPHSTPPFMIRVVAPKPETSYAPVSPLFGIQKLVMISCMLGFLSFGVM